MSDKPAKILEEVVREHFGFRDCPEDENECCAGFILAALAVAGYAVVELPPTGSVPAGVWRVQDVGDVFLGDANGVRIRDVGYDLTITRDEARNFAAALLAAAEAVDAATSAGRRLVMVGEPPRHLFKPDRPGSAMCVCGLAQVVHATWRPDTEQLGLDVTTVAIDE